MPDNTTLLNINQEKEGKEFFRIIQYLQNKFPLICASILAISCTIFTLLFNYYLGSMMNILTQPDRSKKDFQIQFLKSFIIAILLVLLHAFNYEMRSFANSELSHDLRYSIYKQILRQDISFFDEEEHSTGILVGSYLSQDVNVVCSNYINTILNAEQDVILSIGGIIIAFFTMWQVALPVTIILIIMVFVYYYGNKYVDKLWEEYHQHSTQSISKVEEVLTSFRTVKSFNNEIYETQRYGKSLNSIQKVIDRISFFKGFKDSIINCLSNFITAFFIYFACYLIVKKPHLGYKSENLLVLIFALLFSANEIVYYLSLFDDLKKAKISSKKILQILEKEPIIDQEKQGEIKNRSLFKGRIEFIDVGFKYKTKRKGSEKNNDTEKNHNNINNVVNNNCDNEESYNSEDENDELNENKKVELDENQIFNFDSHWAVRHLSFVIDAGQTVAIVGESGCGKTTILQLLSRFYEIDEGKILIDGIDIKTINPQFLRTLISTVPQEPVLFSMTIKDNIEYSTLFKHTNGACNFNDVIEASKLGNAHDFIMEIPNGYYAQIQQKSLSGGQKQRICLSRAFLPFIDSGLSDNSLILLLDEATASLDSKSEHLIQNSLNEFDNHKKVTKIIVAHRLTTIFNADKIIVLKNGHAEEEGSHKDLVLNNGLYSNLIKYQLH